MNDILAVAANWWSLPLGLLIIGVSLGFTPGFLLRQIVRLYPADHERRTELIAELHNLPYLKRIPWVFEQLETGIVDGRRARRQEKRAARLNFGLWISVVAHQAARKSPGVGLSGEFEVQPNGAVLMVIRRNDTAERVEEYPVPSHLHEEAVHQSYRRSGRALW